MARHYNYCNFIGNITDHIELNYTNNNTAVTNFSIAVNRNFQDANNEWQEDTTFIDCTAWGRDAENLEQYSGKGDRIMVVGDMRQDEYETNSGETRQTMFLNVETISLMDSDGQGNGGGGNNSGNQQRGNEPVGAGVEEDQDDIPF